MAAGQAYLEVPGADPDGALSTALEKIGTVLGVGPSEGLEVELAGVDADMLETLRQSAAGHRRIRIGYYSFGRDGHSERVVQPGHVFNSAGQWYLSGWCETAGGQRLFRLDRITALEATSDRFTPGPTVEPGPPATYHPAPDDPVWVLDLDPPAHWIAEQYPNEAVESKAGGVLRVRLRTAQRAWLERLLLRAGPHARVVEGDATVGPAAAGRLLARYRDG
jgi:proteasome accessory factor C